MTPSGFLGFVIVLYYLQVYCEAQQGCSKSDKDNPSPPSSLTLASYTTSSVVLSWTPTIPTQCINSYSIMSNTSNPSMTTDVMVTQETLTVPSNNEPSTMYYASVATVSSKNNMGVYSEPIYFILDVPAPLLLMYDISDGNLTLTWTSDQDDRPPITAYYINLLDSSSLQVLQVTLSSMVAISQHTIVLPDNFNVATIKIIATNALGNNTGSQVNVSQPSFSSISNPLPTTSAMFSMSSLIVTTATGMPSSTMPPSTSNPIITVASTANPSLDTTSLSATSSISNPTSVTTLFSSSTSNPFVTTDTSTGNPEVTTSILSTSNSIVMTSSMSSTSNPPLVTTSTGNPPLVTTSGSSMSPTSNPPLVTTSTGNPFTTSVSSMSSATSNPHLVTTLTSSSSSSNSLVTTTMSSSLGNPSITTLSLATTFTTVSIASNSTSLLSFTSSLTKQSSSSQYSSVVLPSSETTISEPSVSLRDSSSKGMKTSNTVSAVTPVETTMATMHVSSSSSRVVISPNSSSSVTSIATPSIFASAPPASSVVSVIGGTVGGVLLLIAIGIVLIVVIVCITFRIKKNSKAYDVNTLEGEAIKINNAMYMEVGEHTISNGGLVTKSELHPPIPTRHASLGTHVIANESTANVPAQQGETSKVELPTYQEPKSIRREVATSTGSIYTVHQKKTHSNQSSMVHVPASVEYADLSFTSRPQPNVNQSLSEDDYDNISLVGSNAPNKINYTEVSFQGKDMTSRPIVNPQLNDDYDYILSTKSNVPETHQTTSKPQPNVNQSNDDYDDILSCLPSVPNGVEYNPQTGQYN